MKIRFQYTEYKDLPEEATIYSYQRSKNGALLSILCGAGFLIGLSFLIGYKVFGLLAPISILVISVGGFLYLCTGYQKKTLEEIERMRKVQKDAERAEEQALERFKSGEVKIDNPVLQARMEIWAKTKKE